MTKITLRSYNREIEALTDQGKVDLAIAHSIHILKYFPKHVDTYRLLGKAYLENQRLGDAADIFQRVLSAVPDDFVSHIGMSIIREDEGNLDASIWHMQRAYDVQSSNITIQDELRRLYDKRDGIEPPKIRLTRAALARMYARGDLINEAITELRSALQEEPDRADLLVLLARMYYTNNQRVKSIQTCSQVLNKLPFCLNANIIISQALTDTNRAEEAKPYQDKARELDPYAAYLSEHAPTVNLVPDAAVTLLKLEEHEISSGEAQPTWVASLGVDMPSSTSEEEDIDWLLETAQFDPGSESTAIEDFADETDFEASLAASEAFGAALSEMGIEEGDAPTQPEEIGFEDFEDADDAIPDWMQDAGWEPRDPAKPEPESEALAFEDDQIEFDDSTDTIVPADIPDWLKAMAPPEAVEETTPNIATTEGSGDAFDPESTQASMDMPDWLKELDSGSDETVIGETELAAGEDDIPDWLSGTETGGEETVMDATAGAAASAMPDWLSEIDADETGDKTEPPGDLPDWLGELDAEEDTETPAIQSETPDWLGETEPQEEMETAAGDVPDWLSELETEDDAEQVEADGIPDWLGDQEDDGLATEMAVPDAIEAPETLSTVPDWLQELETEDEAPSAVDETPADEESADDWLASLGTAEDEADFEEKPAETEDTEADEDLPEWLKDMAKQAGDSSAVSSERTGVTLWLRRNSETQPDHTEETVSEDEFELDFDETATMQSPRPSEIKALGDLSGDELTGEKAGEDVPAWLQGFDDELLPDATEQEEIETTATAAEMETSAETEAAGMPDMDDTDAALRWLESLAAKQGASEEELLTSPEERTDTPPAWVQNMASAAAAETAAAMDAEADEFEDTSPVEAVDDEPEGLVWDEFEEKAVEAAAAEPLSTEEDLSWLDEFTDEESVSTPIEPEEAPTEVEDSELPEWLKDIEIEETETVAEDSANIPAWLQDIEIEETGTGTETADWAAETQVSVPEEVVSDITEEDDDYVWEQETPEPEETQPGGRPSWWSKATAPLSAAMVEAQQEEEASPEVTAGEPVAITPKPAASQVQTPSDFLFEAREALSNGNLQASLAGYKKLIRKKNELGAVIDDLTNALQHSHPVNIDIWTMLGDAYAKNNNLQKALDAYTKAEELIR